MSFKLKIVTPEKVYFEGEVDILNIKLNDGYVGILPHHMPLVSMVTPCAMSIRANGITTEYAIHGGVINVNEESTLLLANMIERKDEIDIERAKRAEERANKRLNSNDPNIDMKRARLALARALLRDEVYNKK